MRVAVAGQLLIIVAAVAAIACSEAQTKGQAAGKSQPAAKSVSAEAVVQESVRRSLDVVATLAAADEVVVSSEADGVVRRIMADLGDRVTEGQVLVELDREKSAYGYDQQKAAPARSPRTAAPISTTSRGGADAGRAARRGGTRPGSAIVPSA